MDFDDSLFETKPVKVRHVTARPEDYQARIASDGWFNSPESSWESQFTTERLGPNNLQYMVERLYLLKDYTQALKASEKWMELNEARSKPMQQLDLTLIAARCALRLDQPAKALQFLEKASATSHDPDLISLKGHTLRLLGRCHEALKHYKHNMELRGNDYKTLKELALLFENHQQCWDPVSSSFSCAPKQQQEDEETEKPTISISVEEIKDQCRHGAYAAMQRAHWLAIRSGRPDSEIAKRNEAVELSSMAQYVAKYKPDTITHQISSLQFGFSKDMMEWIAATIPYGGITTAGDVDDEEVEDLERKVREM
ncbi:hypothetical protein HDV05_006222 [Chytridiales sp. JEL 0842]|nr:hypothetical protein HDV05_006222 [Chytridiales sp. JEL 0842]